MEYRHVEIKDAPFLYEMLKERNDTMNISHKSMPVFGEHCDFIKSKPYKQWFIITSNSIPIGNYYLTDSNEIGVFILKQFQNKGIGKLVVDHILSISGRYLANISPKNEISQKFFKGLGFKRIQFTYEYDNSIKMDAGHVII